MEKRKLGSSDLDVSVLGMGCWQYGGGDYWGEQSQKDVNNIVHQALDVGINYFDTAEVYNNGESEKSLGNALKGKREMAVIGSKITPANLHPSVLRKHCEDSLARLQTDYIDVYMVHWPVEPHAIEHFTNDVSLISNPTTLQEAFDGLAALQQEGKIRHIGISNHGVEQMKAVQATGVPFVVNELAYNLLSRAIEAHILPYCIENEIGVIGYMPLQQGLLTGNYTSLEAVKPMQARSRHFHFSRGTGSRHGETGAEEEIKVALKEIQILANELGVDMITLSLAWAIARKGMTTAIVGCRNEKQLAQNIQGALYHLENEAIEKLNQITDSVKAKLGDNPDYYENRNNSRIR